MNKVFCDQVKDLYLVRDRRDATAKIFYETHDGSDALMSAMDEGDFIFVRGTINIGPKMSGHTISHKTFSTG